MKNTILLFANSLVASVLFVSTAQALTLDDFGVTGAASSSSPGAGEVSVTSSSGAVGGFRTLFAIKNSFGAGFTRLETFPDPNYFGDQNFSLGYTQGVHTGQGIVTWDGDNIGSTISTSGLGSVDLTQDDGTAIRVAIKFFDYPSSQPIDIALRLYDSGNPSGLKYSDLALTLNKGVTAPVLLVIPYTSFTTAGASQVSVSNGDSFPAATSFGPAGPIDMTKLGAAQLILNGLANSNAPDLTLDFVSTNGRCSMIPNSQGRVVDECGVCLDSQFANKGKDQCGVCLYGPTPYAYKSVTDECGLCPSAPNYSHSKDACGVCGGTVTDASKCVTAQGACVTVAATKEVLKFEDRLMVQAKTALSRFRDESRRSIANKCKIDLTQMTKKVNRAFTTIRSDGEATFTKGVEVCGDSCVTISYAAQVKTLNPQFSLIQRITTSLANEVSKCYRKKNIKQTGGTRGNATTFQNINSGLNQLIADCRERQVCPPK